MQIVGLLFSLANYFFVFLFLFNLLKVDYFNPIVSVFLKIYNPISKVLGLFSSQIINIFIFAVIFKFISLYIYFGTQFEIISLIGVAVIQSIMIFLRIIFFAIIGGVILSWISPKNSNPFLKLIEEVSHKSLAPIRKYIPSAGGLDFSPIFILILINLLESFLTDILRSMV